MKISCLSFVYNEAEKVAESLESVAKWVDEIIFFDLESTDGTGDVARKFTNRVYRRPHLLVGDMYKMELTALATGDWLLWLDADEVWCPNAGKYIRGLLNANKIRNVFQFMRREFRDGIRIGCGPDGRFLFGTYEAPNYQVKMAKKCPELFCTELIHAAVFGDVSLFSFSEDCYIEHRKTNADQDFDSVRSYIWYQHLIFKYGDTKTQPYKTYVDSYKKIVHDSEARNLAGDRRILLTEEFWWCWRRYANVLGMTLNEFKEWAGISYPEFLELKDKDLGRRMKLEYEIRNKVW